MFSLHDFEMFPYEEKKKLWSIKVFHKSFQSIQS